MPYAAIEGPRLYYERAGSGEPKLLFVFERCCGWRAFKPQFDHFAHSHAVTAVDQRGFGKSDRPESGVWTEGMGARDPEQTRWITDHMCAAPLSVAAPVIRSLNDWNGVGALSLCEIPFDFDVRRSFGVGPTLAPYSSGGGGDSRPLLSHFATGRECTRPAPSQRSRVLDGSCNAPTLQAPGMEPPSPASLHRRCS
jgi:hypothetical protein